MFRKNPDPRSPDPEPEEGESLSAPPGLGAPDRNVVTVGDDGALAWRADGTPLPPLPGGATPTRWARACPAAAEVAVVPPWREADAGRAFLA